jgi:Ca2+-binding EF-hand superfamily protein
MSQESRIEQMVNEIFAKYDRNDDQHLSYGEATAYIKDSIHWKAQFNVEKLFEVLDENSNNQVSKEELKNFLKTYIII